VTPQEAFRARLVIPTEPSSCWTWTGAPNRDGYGELKVDGRRYMAHRRAFELFRGPIPEGKIVRHHCDNPPCCNPTHLAVGTFKDNAMDAIERGRAFRLPPRLGTTSSYRGTRQKGAKLTDAKVVWIRRLYAAGCSIRPLARAYGVSFSVIARVVSGKDWRHVLEEEIGEDFPALLPTDAA
jgi:hypothetical protein